MRNVLSKDTVWLAIHSAKHMLYDAGVTNAKCNVVLQKILDCWKQESDKNPLKGMF